VFGLAIAVAVFAGAGSYVSASAFGDGFGPALAVSAAFSLAGALVALALPGRRHVAQGAAVVIPGGTSPHEAEGLPEAA
jgi:hypothetical protein